MKKSNTKLQFRPEPIICIIIVLMVVFLSVGYSAFSSELDINGINALVQIEKNVRITGLTVDSVTNGASSSNEGVNVTNIGSEISLPNSNSKITYSVEITNMGSAEVGLKEIRGLPSNLKYSISNYNLKDTLCDDTFPTECKLGSISKLLVTIEYDTNGYNSSNTNYLLNLDFIISQVFTINYYGFSNTSGLASTILDGDSIVITFNNNSIIPYDVQVQNATGTYNSPNLTLTNPTANVSITRYYRINYNLDGGTNSANNPDRFLAIDNILLESPIKSNYVFGGWFENSSFTGTATTAIQNRTSDVTLYARWDNTIAYVLNGGEQAPNPVLTYHSSRTTPLLNPSRSGYDFAGWYEDPSLTGTKIIDTSQLSGNVTLYARWAQIYTITYVLNGGTQASDPVTEFSEVNIQTLKNPSNSHDAEFEGWYRNSDKITSTQSLTGNTNLSANWVSGFTNNMSFDHDSGKHTATTIASRLELSTFTTSSTYQYTHIATTDIEHVQIFINYTTGNATPTVQCRAVGGTYGNSTSFTFSRRASNTEVNKTIDINPAIPTGTSYTVSCYSYSNDGNGNNRTRINGFAFIINP